jgi:hypothetical protein
MLSIFRLYIRYILRLKVFTSAYKKKKGLNIVTGETLKTKDY